MKKMICLFCLLVLCSFTGMAQQFALIDMEYILKNIPEYKTKSEALGKQAEVWQKEVEVIQTQAQELYKKYQSEIAKLSPEMRSKSEEAIVKKEQEAQDVKRKYFGTDGEMAKQQQALLKPIQDKIYEAVKEISEEDDIQLVIDRASAMSIIFASPAIDMSNDVLAKLGYSK